MGKQPGSQPGEFNSLLEGLADACLIIDSNCRFTFINSKATEILGVLPDSIIGKSIDQVVLKGNDDSLFKTCCLVMDTQEYQVIERYYSANQGWYESHIYPSQGGVLVFFKNMPERKKSEKNTDGDYKKFFGLIENNFDIISLYDDRLQVIYRSPSFTRITGWTEAEIENVDFATHIHPEDRGIVKEFIAQALERPGTPFHYSFRFQHKMGHFIWLEGNATKFEEEQLHGLLFNSRVVSERKLAEEKLNESVNRYRRLFDTSPIAITEEDHTAFYEKVESLRATGVSENYSTYFDSHGEELYEMLGRVKILGVNQGLLKLTGAKNLEDFVANRSRFFVSMTEMTVFKLMDLIREGGGYFEEETKIKSLSGEIKEVVVRLKYPAAPPYNSVAITMLDVTERKRFEQKITESEELFRTFSDNIQNLAWIADKDGWIYWYNQRWYDYTGTTFEEMRGWGWGKVHHPDYINSVVDFVKDAWHRPEPFELTFPLKGADGGYRWFLTRCVPTLDTEGKIVRWIGTNTDIHDQKLAQEKIKESEEKFRGAFNASPDAISLSATKSGKILEVNEGFSRILGISREEAIGKTAVELKIIKDAKRREESLENRKAEGFTTLEVRFNKRQQGEFYGLLSFKSILWDNEECIISFLRDISESKKAEEELAFSQNRIKKIFDSGIIGILFWDANGEILDANDRFLAMTGYSKNDLLEKRISWHKMTPPEYEKEDQLALEQIAINGVCQPFEKEYICKDGSRISIILGGATFDGLDGRQGVAYVMDISERKKAELNLKESENYLRTILETEPECVKILNNRGQLVSMNRAGLAMIEADHKEQAVGKRMTSLVNEEYRMAFNKLSKEVFNGKTGTLEFEITGLKGGHRWLETHAVPLKNGEGEIINLLGVTRDITQRKIAEEKISKTTEQLRQLTAHLQNIREKERKRIAREIHDELGQQLTAIKMDTVWIDKQLSDASSAIKEKLQNILVLLDHGNTAVKRILNELRPAVLENSDLIETLQWQSKQFENTSGSSLTFTSNQSSITVSRETATCIFRVYQEILTNIMRYAGASKVTSSLNIHGSTIVLIVEDNGKGFDAQVENKKSFGILGMKERVFSLNGKFNLFSSANKGTKVIVHLPLNTA